MELIDLYEQIQNPIDDLDVIKQLLQIEAESGSFYGQLTKRVKKDNINKYSNADSDELYSTLFNKWKNNILALTDEQVDELLKNGSYKQDFIKLRNYLKTIPDVTTKKEADNVFEDEYEDQELKEAIEKYKWTAVGEYSSWVHVFSRYLTAKQDPSQKIEHRLYLDTECIHTHKMASYFIEKCDKYHLPYYFKFAESGNRDDTLVIYSSTENLIKYIEILREIQKEHPDFIAQTKTPPLLTGKIDGWIGYGTEPAKLPDGSNTSFNELRSNVIEKVIVNERKNWLEKNSKTKFEHNGNLTTIKEYITEKAIEDMFNQMHNHLQPFGKNPKLSIKEQKERHGYSEEDLNNPMFKNNVFSIISDQIDKYFKGQKEAIEGIKFVSYWTTKPNIRNILSEFTPKIAEIDPSFIKKVQEEIKIESKKAGIDIDKYCFDTRISKIIKNASQKQVQPEIKVPPQPVVEPKQSKLVILTEQQKKN